MSDDAEPMAELQTRISDLEQRFMELEVAFMERGAVVDTLELLVREQAEQVARLQRQVQSLLDGGEFAPNMSAADDINRDQRR